MNGSDLRPTSERVEIFGVDVQGETVAKHRWVACSSGKPTHGPSGFGEATRWSVSALVATVIGLVVFTRRDPEGG